MELTQWQMNRFKNPDFPACLASRKEIKRVVDFHQTLPAYEPTPLVPLDSLAKHLGLGDIFVKDESQRLGLNSFKSLGTSYAIANYLDDKHAYPCEALQRQQMEITA
jgi:diaminopropionate ammonia-lyase